ncbi:MAG: hypothetical protein WCB04_14525 [Mycobacteriales bacterium]
MNLSNVEETRRGLHAVGEQVLAGPQYLASGTIRLRITAGGFATVADPGLQVDGMDLVSGDQRLPISGMTAEALGRAVGVAAGIPEGLYNDHSGVRTDRVLTLDPDAARWIAECFANGDQAMRQLAPSETPVLWPEHFDVAITAEAMGYGVSPGDSYHAEPYAYVTPATPRSDDFWSAPFGALRPMRDLPDADSLLAFFTEARDRG